MRVRLRKYLLALEFLILFFGIPLLMLADSGFIHPSSVILPLLVFIFLILKFRTDFRFKELIYWKVSKTALIRSGLFVLISSIIMVLVVIIIVPGNLFDLPRKNLMIWLLLCTFYPIFSAFGQEIIYRTFLFHRYKPLFKNKWVMIFASGISFGFVHILYYNPISMILTFFGGLWIAFVYTRTRSVLFAAVLHGILGILVFTIGLGQYFWLDMYEWL